MAGIEIILNGETLPVPDNFTLLDLIRELGLEEARVAVELNRSIVKRPEWGKRMLEEGDRVEVVHFVGGGSRVRSESEPARAFSGRLHE